MKRILFVLIVISNLNNTNAQSIDWLNSFGGTEEDVVWSLDVDDSGNTYTTGYFTGSMQIGSITLTSEQNMFESFVVKTDANGVPVWAKQFGRAQSQLPNEDSSLFKAVAVDQSGNVFIGGYFSGNFDADPNDNEQLLASNGAYDNLIIKLNSDGDFVWAQSFGSTEASDFEEVYSLDTDADGNVYAVGHYNTSMSFVTPFGTQQITSNGSLDIYAIKFTSEGFFDWVRTAGGSGPDLSIKVKVSGNNVFLTGAYEGTAIFESSILGEVSLVNQEFNRGMYLLNINTDGFFVNVVKIGESNSECIANDIVISEEENDIVYVTGTFGLTMTLNENTPDEFEISSNNFAGLVAKVSISTNKVEWAKPFTADEDSVFSYAIGIDLDGNVFLSGFYDGTLTMGDFSITKLSSLALENFLLKVSSDGNPLGLYQHGGSNNIDTQCLKIDANNNIIISGSYAGTVDLSPLVSEELEASSLGFRDNYILKLEASTLSTQDIEFQKGMFSIHPNPTEDVLHISSSNKPLFGETFKVYDLTGKIVNSGIIGMEQQVSFEGLSKGVYVLSVKDDVEFKVVKK